MAGYGQNPDPMFDFKDFTTSKKKTDSHRGSTGILGSKTDVIDWFGRPMGCVYNIYIYIEFIHTTYNAYINTL